VDRTEAAEARLVGEGFPADANQIRRGGFVSGESGSREQGFKEGEDVCHGVGGVVVIVSVGVGVLVAVAVGVAVGVSVTVGEGVMVGVSVGRGVQVLVNVGEGVHVRVGGRNGVGVM